MSQQRKTARRARGWHPLDIRGWVVGKSPEDIYKTLQGRIDAIEEAIEPHREPVRRFSELFYNQVFVKELGLPPAPIVPERVDVTARSLAWLAVAWHWRNRPYRGKYLPRITFRGQPWEVFPHEVHLLDLDPRLVVDTLRKSLPFEWITTVMGRPPSPLQAVPITDALVSMVVGIIDFDGIVAWTNPLVQYITFEVLKTAHHSPTKGEREEAAAALGQIFNAFKPDLSQHMERREETLLPLLDDYEALYGKIGTLHDELKRNGPTRAGLARFRDELEEPTVKLTDLQRWRTMPREEIALAALARRTKRSPRTLGDLLTLARKARGIENAWSGFRQWWEEEVSERDRCRVLPSISPFLPFTRTLPPSE